MNKMEEDVDKMSNPLIILYRFYLSISFLSCYIFSMFLYRFHLSLFYLFIKIYFPLLPNFLLMAPPVPVFSAAEIRSRYKDQINNPDKYQCTLRELTQHQCTFKTHEDAPPDIICLPFKRIFQRCLMAEKVKNQVKERWINIEVTDAETNADLFREKKYEDVVNEFMSTEKEFQQMMLKWETEGRDEL